MQILGNKRIKKMSENIANMSVSRELNAIQYDIDQKISYWYDKMIRFLSPDVTYRRFKNDNNLCNMSSWPKNMDVILNNKYHLLASKIIGKVIMYNLFGTCMHGIAFSVEDDRCWFHCVEYQGDHCVCKLNELCVMSDKTVAQVAEKFSKYWWTHNDYMLFGLMLPRYITAHEVKIGRIITYSRNGHKGFGLVCDVTGKMCTFYYASLFGKKITCDIRLVKVSDVKKTNDVIDMFANPYWKEADCFEFDEFLKS